MDNTREEFNSFLEEKPQLATIIRRIYLSFQEKEMSDQEKSFLVMLKAVKFLYESLVEVSKEADDLEEKFLNHPIHHISEN